MVVVNIMVPVSVKYEINNIKTKTIIKDSNRIVNMSINQSITRTYCGA